MLNLRNGVSETLFYQGFLVHFDFHFLSDSSDHVETAQRSKLQRSLNLFCDDRSDRSDHIKTSLNTLQTS